MRFGLYSLPYAIMYHLISTGDMYLFGYFSLSHTFTPVIESHEDPSWILYAIEHIVDISSTNPFVTPTKKKNDTKRIKYKLLNVINENKIK